MGKIKGWKKIKDNEWESDMFIAYNKTLGGNFGLHRSITIRHDAFGYFINGIPNQAKKRYSSKSEAEKFAIKYMKSHPRG